MANGFPQPPDDWEYDMFEPLWWQYDPDFRRVTEYEHIAMGIPCGSRRLCPPHLPVFGVIEESYD